ncbi:Non-essential glycogen phosphorylase [Rhodotorula toruloides]|uniref:Alpha-1,4 glucan phosphorylase n=1 Tax=Rhodotorula toruloides TaxID=5286 RepID=A0A2T0AB43_RHOTO|nr:glycosyltransferase family 35 protein [Rhodotorula toruloides]
MSNGADSTPTTPKATHEANPFEKLANPRRVRAHKRSATGFIPEGPKKLSEIFPGDAKAWKTAIAKNAESLKTDVDSINAQIVHHVETTLARAAFNVDEMAMYQAAALSVRDRLIHNWDVTQTFHTQARTKRVYYFSLEYLLGRGYDNALLNLGVRQPYNEGLKGLGFNMEDVIDVERDMGLGNGGLGRLAACYLDSTSTLDIPCWGYTLRYSQGIFKQIIDSSGNQVEVPDPWLENQNPWEIPRLDNAVEIKFHGEATPGEGGKGPGTWTGGLDVLAVPYDIPVPGYKTQTTNNIRAWSARGKVSFDLAKFNAGDYDAAVREAEEAETITRVLYPNENFDKGKALRLKQQYFWVAASLHDICRRFRKLRVPWSEFPDYNAIQLNDTHPTLAIPELMRILVDEEGQPWDEAWEIVRRTFSYTNHTVLSEALEKWSVPLVEWLLPRHLQIIYEINLDMLKDVEKRWPNDRARLARMSLIEEGYPKMVRMANLAVVGSHRVNGVAALHSHLVQQDLFPDFVEYLGRDHFGNVTNGVTARRWLLQCNPSLAKLITDTLGSDEWVVNLDKLEGLTKYAKDKAFQKKWAACKQANRERLCDYIEATLGLTVNRHALIDVQVKRIHEYKRQFMNILGVIFRYLQLKKMSPADRKRLVPRLSVFAGKAAPGYYIAKLIIRLCNAVSKTINADKDIRESLSVAFLPDYSVSLAEIIIPASDISEHISTAGTEASGTSNMKFALNGGLLLGTLDGANIEIAEAVGDENVFFFGHVTPDVPKLRRAHHFGEVQYPAELLEVVDAIRSGMFGEAGVFEPLLGTLFEGKDHYLVSDDFLSYLQAQKMVDEAYVDQPSWVEKTINSTARMGRFASDRAVLQYAEEIWNIEPIKIPQDA